jgi:hypothetical protein
MGDLIGKRLQNCLFNSPWLKGRRSMLLAVVCLLHAFIWTSVVLTSDVALAARPPAVEFVVPGGPIITLQDGQRIDGHIVKFDQTNVVIRSMDGSEQTVPRATVDRVIFETVTGAEISGSLLGWKPGVYELTTEDSVVAVYSIAPPPPPAEHEEEQEHANGVAEDNAEPVVAVDAERGLNGAVVTDEVEKTGDVETELAATTPGSDLEIAVSVDSTREDAGPIGFDIQLSKPSESSVVLIYATIDDTAIDGEDYQAARGVLVIKAGQTDARIEAPIIDDEIGEEEEQLRLFLTVDPAVAVVKNREIIATIEDNDRDEDLE